jgi:hypothetical protein
LPPQVVEATSTLTCRSSPWWHGLPVATTTDGRCRRQTCRHSTRRQEPAATARGGMCHVSTGGCCRHREGGLFCQLYSQVVFFVNLLGMVVLCDKNSLQTNPVSLRFRAFSYVSFSLCWVEKFQVRPELLLSKLQHINGLGRVRCSTDCMVFSQGHVVCPTESSYVLCICSGYRFCVAWLL